MLGQQERLRAEEWRDGLRRAQEGEGVSDSGEAECELIPVPVLMPRAAVTSTRGSSFQTERFSNFRPESCSSFRPNIQTENCSTGRK